MSIFEYKVMPVGYWKDVREGQLDAMGAKGWELIATIEGKVVFKREKTNDWVKNS